MLERATVLLFLLAAMLYSGAGVLYVYFFVSKIRRVSIAASLATGAGFILHTVVLALRWAQLRHPPIEGAFGAITMIAWWVVLAYFIVEHLVRIKTLGILMIPVAVFLMAWAGVNYQPPSSEIAAILRSNQVILHLAMVFTAYASFTVGAGAGVLYLIQERQLKKKKLGAFFRRLPPLDQLDELERRAVIVGVPFVTVGLLLGIIQAIRLVPNWFFEPLVLLALFMWAYYVAYLLLRAYAGWAGRRAAWMAILGIALISALRVLATLNEQAVFHRFGG